MFRKYYMYMSLTIQLNEDETNTNKIEFFYNYEKECISFEAKIEIYDGTVFGNGNINDIDAFIKNIRLLYDSGAKNGEDKKH